jgi:hypothetical protein
MDLKATQPQSMNLDYAPASPKRRKWLRRGTVLGIILACASAGWRWGPAAWRQGRILYRQQQCMTYTVGPDVVVYEEESTAAAKLLSSGSEYRPSRFLRPLGLDETPITITAAAHAPMCWDHFAAANGWGTSRVAGPLMLLGAGPSLWSTIFLHERTSPSGHRRLIDLEYSAIDSFFTPMFLNGHNCRVCAMSPATLWKPLIPLTSDDDIEIKGYVPQRPPNVRIYAGQPDPADPSHFTIRYEMWGKDDIIDGYLQDDDYVRIKQRNVLTDRSPVAVPR